MSGPTFRGSGRELVTTVQAARESASMTVPHSFQITQLCQLLKTYFQQHRRTAEALDFIGLLVVFVVAKDTRKTVKYGLLLAPMHVDFHTSKSIEARVRPVLIWTALREVDSDSGMRTM
jgi:hypothetical protein